MICNFLLYTFKLIDYACMDRTDCGGELLNITSDPDVDCCGTPGVGGYINLISGDAATYECTSCSTCECFYCDHIDYCFHNKQRSTIVTFEPIKQDNLGECKG